MDLLAALIKARVDHDAAKVAAYGADVCARFPISGRGEEGTDLRAKYDDLKAADAAYHAQFAARIA